MRPTNYSAGSQFKGKVFVPGLRLEFSNRMNRNLSVLFTFIISFCVFVILVIFIPILIAFLISFIIAILSFAIAYHALEHIDDKARESKIKLFYYDQIKKYQKITDADGQEHYLTGKKEGEVYEGKTIL